MQTTTVSQLKMSINACLRQVKAGEELFITEYGWPVARLLPVADLVSLPQHLVEMEKKGLLKRAEKSLPEDFRRLPRPTNVNATVRSTVSQKREESW